MIGLTKCIIYNNVHTFILSFILQNFDFFCFNSESLAPLTNSYLLIFIFLYDSKFVTCQILGGPSHLSTFQTDDSHTPVLLRKQSLKFVRSSGHPLSLSSPGCHPKLILYFNTIANLFKPDYTIHIPMVYLQYSPIFIIHLSSNFPLASPYLGKDFFNYNFKIISVFFSYFFFPFNYDLILPVNQGKNQSEYMTP